MPFRFQPLEIPGMVLVQPFRRGDERAFFEEVYRRSHFVTGGIGLDFVQDNCVRSSLGVLRGLHFQRPPQPQGKLIRVTRGRVFDVGVDLRVGSPTYGKWVGVTLDDQTGSLLYLPPGLAHGYQVLSDQADLSYKVTAEFAPTLDAGIRWDDPDLGIQWPLAEPALSEKDRALPALREVQSPFRFPGAGA
jgi:dTDP-4-dehydrorhamnose 3,5-epimerase